MGRGRAGGRTASREWSVGERKSASGAPECPAKQQTEGPWETLCRGGYLWPGKL